MKKRLLVLSITALLCACGSPPSDSDARPGAIASPPGPGNAPAAAPARASTVSEVTSPAVASSAASDPDGAKAVDDAIDSNLGDHRRYRAVIDALQQAVAGGDAAGVARLVQYPIGVRIGGRNVTLKNPGAFVEHYDEVMTPGIRKAVLDTRYRDLFVNYKGVMFGQGQVWINGMCKDAQCKDFDVRVVTLQEGPG